MKLTENEKSLLNIIATSEFNSLNGNIPRTPEESATWLFMDDLADESGLTVNQVKGVLGSMVKKNLISVDDFDKKETLLTIEKNGIDELWIVG